MGNLGACCSCATDDGTVNHIVKVPFVGPTPGMGWGCKECGVLFDGAVAVLCDSCYVYFVRGEHPVYLCAGSVSSGDRVPASAYTEPFVHTMAEHRHKASLRANAAIGGRRRINDRYPEHLMMITAGLN